MIQYILNGKEYTTRYRLAEKYGVTKTGGILQQVLEKTDIPKIQDRNQVYYLKDEIESILDKALKRK